MKESNPWDYKIYDFSEGQLTRYDLFLRTPSPYSPKYDWWTNLTPQELQQTKQVLNWPLVLSGLDIDYKIRSTGTMISLCPLHFEKTPSAFYYPKSQRFHCYGCGQDCDILSFVVRVRFENQLIIDKEDWKMFIRSMSGPRNDPKQTTLP